MNNTKKQQIIESVTACGAVWDKATKTFFVHTNKRSVNIFEINNNLDVLSDHQLTILTAIVNDNGNINLQIH